VREHELRFGHGKVVMNAPVISGTCTENTPNPETGLDRFDGSSAASGGGFPTS
jgi:hypothetical protein